MVVYRDDTWFFSGYRGDRLCIGEEMFPQDVYVIGESGISLKDCPFDQRGNLAGIQVISQYQISLPDPGTIQFKDAFSQGGSNRIDHHDSNRGKRGCIV